MKPAKGSTIYIAGPMSGIHCFNFKLFFYWQVRLEREGYTVINPAEIDCVKMFDGWQYSPDQWEAVLQEDCELIRTKADAVFAMSGWTASKGAMREVGTAVENGISVYHEIDWEEPS